MIRYQHSQFAWWVPALTFVMGVIILAVLISEREASHWGWLLALLPLAIGLMFHKLVVTIDAHYIRIAYGIGLIRVKWALSTIQSYRPVRNRWWYGWGIRWFPGGILFNVSGLDAVEIVLHDGLIRRIGTDDPDGLQAALMQTAASS